MSEPLQFLKRFPGSEIYATVPDDGAGSFYHYHARFSDCKEKLDRDNQSGRGVFFTVNDLDRSLDPERKRTKKMFKRARAIWVEDDEKRIAARADWPIPPNLIVNSSSGKFHYYWLTGTEDSAAWESVMQRMVTDYGCDPQARDLARVLRLPGFHHCKRERYAVTFERGRAEPYEWPTILEHFPPIVLRSKSSACGTPGLSIAELLNESAGGHQHGPSRALAMKLANYGLPKEEALALMRAVLPNEHHDGHHEQSLDTAYAKVAGEASGWEPFRELPDPMPSVPKLNPLLIPESLRTWVVDVSERMSAPLDFAGAAAMVSLGAVVGRQVGIRPLKEGDWTVTPNLWGAVIGRPGKLKSPALAEVMKPLRILEDRAREAHVQAVKEHTADGEVRAALAKVSQKKIEAAVNRDDKDGALRIALAATEGELPVPERRRIRTNDVTVEKLGELLAANPRGILVFRDELTGWLKDMDKQGHESARAFYLESWNGTGSFVYDRIGRGTVDIPAACVSVLGGIQPGPLSSYLRHALEGGAGDDGLLQRLQVAVWPDAEPWVECDRAPDMGAQRSAYETFRRLDEIDPSGIGANLLGGIPYLRFDCEAQTIWNEWRRDFERSLHDFDGHPAVEAAIAKQRSLLPSLALLIHLADNPAGGPVSANALRMAIGWVEYLEGHAKRIYAPALFGPLTTAHAIARHIRKGALPATFQVKTICDKGWSGLTETDEVRKALELLESHGWVRSVEQKRTGGRPRMDWELNTSMLVRAPTSTGDNF